MKTNSDSDKNNENFDSEDELKFINENFEMLEEISSNSNNDDLILVVDDLIFDFEKILNDDSLNFSELFSQSDAHSANIKAMKDLGFIAFHLVCFNHMIHNDICELK